MDHSKEGGGILEEKGKREKKKMSLKSSHIGTVLPLLFSLLSHFSIYSSFCVFSSYIIYIILSFNWKF